MKGLMKLVQAKAAQNSPLLLVSVIEMLHRYWLQCRELFISLVEPILQRQDVTPHNFSFVS